MASCLMSDAPYAPWLSDVLAMLEEKTGLPVLGVVPYLHVEIEDEDSLSERLNVRDAVKPLGGLIRERDAQCVPFHVERRPRKIIATRVICRRICWDGITRCLDFQLSTMSTDKSRPAFVIPLHLLDRCLTPERAPATRIPGRFCIMIPRASRQRRVVPFTARRLDQGAMPLFLQREIRRIKIRDERAIWFRDKGIHIQRSKAWRA